VGADLDVLKAQQTHRNSDERQEFTSPERLEIVTIALAPQEHESENTYDFAQEGRALTGSETWQRGAGIGRGPRRREGLALRRHAFLVQSLLVPCPGSSVIGQRQLGLGLGQPEVIQVAHHTHKGIPP